MLTAKGLHFVQSPILKLPKDLEHKKSINISNHSIEICCHKKCINYNLFKLGALLNNSIPEYIHYKVELKDSLLYSNTKAQNYELENKNYTDGNIRLNISLGVDNKHWRLQEENIRKPFWYISLFIISNLLLLYLFYKITLRKFNNAYNLHYLEKYKDELKRAESTLMERTWNIDFFKQKDLEINCLFAQEANRIAFLDNNIDDQESIIKDNNFKNFSNKAPCSIILYRSDIKEEINLVRLSKIFSERFSSENEKLLIMLPTETKAMSFVSEAALYQIIYSITCYLFFWLKNESPACNHQIKLSIKTDHNRLILLFEYQGSHVRGEEELFKISNNFFRTHANPFLLNINQIYNLLKANDYNFNISYDKRNVIEILESNKSIAHPKTNGDNVISLSSAIKKRK